MAALNIKFVVTSSSQFGLVDHLSTINSHAARQRHKHRTSQSLALKSEIQIQKDARIEQGKKKASSEKPIRLNLGVKKPKTLGSIAGLGLTATSMSICGACLKHWAKCDCTREKVMTGLVSSTNYHSTKSPQIVGSGIGDPFRSTAVPVNEQFCRIMHFESAFCAFLDRKQTQRHSNMSAGLLAIAERNSARHHVVIMFLGMDLDAEWNQLLHQAADKSLAHQTTGYAYLCSTATAFAIASEDPVMEMTATYFCIEALKCLRQSLAQTPPDVFAASYAVLSLFMVEVSRRNWEAARIHGHNMQYLLQAMPRALIDDRLLHGFMWHEAQRSVKSMTPTLFNVELWCEQFFGFRPLYRKHGSELDLTHLDDGIQDHRLQTIFATLNQYVSFPGSLLNSSNAGLLSISLQCMAFQGILVNDYVDSLLRVRPETQDDQLIGECNQLCLRLAALYWMRRATMQEYDGDTREWSQAKSKVFNAVDGLMDRIRYWLNLSQTAAYSCTQRTLLRVRLWVLYIGAIAEQTKPEFGVEAPMASPYFGKAFVSLALAMGYDEWSDVERVLKRFLYHERIGAGMYHFFETAKAHVLTELSFENKC